MPRPEAPVADVKWTEGEWSLDGHNLGRIIVVRAGPDEQGRQYEDGRHSVEVGLFRRIEDARIASAAPALYEALAKVRDELEPFMGETLALVEAALLAARGRP